MKVFLNLFYLITLSLSTYAFAVSHETIMNSAPIVKLHPDEEYMPSSVEFFLKNTHQDGEYFVTNTPLKHPSDESIPFFRGEFPAKIPPVYAIVVPKPTLGSDVFDVHYFFFHPYNRGKRVCVGVFIGGIGCVGGYSTFGNHVGDWESFRVRFYGETMEDVETSYHSYEAHFSKNDLYFNGTHPVIYSAKDSHGIYIRPGRYVYMKLPNDELVDYTGDGLEWHTYQNVMIIPYHKVGSYPKEFDFLNYTGRWGNPKDASKCAFGQCVLEAGPTGPALKSRVDPYA